MPFARFITFEGGEGCGKSTQAKLLADKLSAKGQDVVLTREPGGTKLAEKLRQVFIETADETISPLALTLMMNAARDSHVRDVIAPALERGAWVVCDRFSHSTRVYQGYVAGLDTKIIADLERWTVRDYAPATTLFMDVPVDIGLARAAARRGDDAADRFERQGKEYHEKLRQGFVDCVKNDPHACICIDGTRDIAVIAAEIWDMISKRAGL